MFLIPSELPQMYGIVEVVASPNVYVAVSRDNIGFRSLVPVSLVVASLLVESMDYTSGISDNHISLCLPGLE